MSDFQKLEEADLKDIIYLQDYVIAHIKAENLAPYIVARADTYFEKHLSHPHKMIGCRKNGNGKLIAQCAFHVPPDFKPKKEIGLDDMPNFEENDSVTILQAALVHPEARGKGLMKNMILDWIDWAKKTNKKHLLARVEVSHQASITVFKKNGFSRIGLVKDARDGADVYVFHKIIEKEA
tara:strand:- start:277 stop:816 length:540 start_codon:yes stop_codon:yes gene_type:complete